jgi:hypothetical protein
MAYRNKTYVCFDADNDMNYYTMMCAWKENDNIAFDFRNAHDLNNLRKTSSEDTIKGKLRERLANTKVMIVLVGEHTRHLYKFVRWEIEYAIEKEIPIIVANLNGSKTYDPTLCPPILKNELAVHIPYGQKTLDYALNHWPKEHSESNIQIFLGKENAGPRIYNEAFYESLI